MKPSFSPTSGCIKKCGFGAFDFVSTMGKVDRVWLMWKNDRDYRLSMIFKSSRFIATMFISFP